MNHRTSTLTLAAVALLTASSASAFKVTGFPERLTPSEKAAKPGMQKAPLNKEAKLGTKVFGYTSIDYDRVRHFVNYYENSYELEKLNTVYDENVDRVKSPDLYMINAGAYNPSDGYYYAYKVEYYTIGITYACQWLKVNPADGSWEVVADLENSFHNSTYLYDLAYSVYDDEMYGLVQNDDGQIKSRIGIIDMSNSGLTDLVQLDNYYFAMAFNYDGDLYAIRWELDSNNILKGTRLDVFDRDFKVVKSMPILVDGNAFLSYFQHGLDFDYTTGDLIWGAVNADGEQYIVRIDPETGATTNYGHAGYSEIIGGFYVPYTTASHREAPAKANDLAFTIDANGANNVTLSWTNPTTTWNRQPLSNLSSVRIYRDTHTGAPVGTISASGKEGEKMTFTDQGASTGVHKYYIIPVNDKGEGVEASLEAYVGHDVPGKVNNLSVSATNSGKSVKISWQEPTTGANDGWFDKKLTYDIDRLPDNVRVATGISALTYTDEDIAESRFYRYVVTPSTADGRGESCTSEGILAGGSLSIPFSTNFATKTEAERFLSFDPYGSRNLFQHSHNINKPGTMAMKYEYQTNNDATLSSPPMNLKKGNTYRVDWEFSLGRYGQSYLDTYNHFKITAGTAPNAQGMDKVLADYPEFLSVKNHEAFTITTYFESPVDGDYYVGLNICTNSADRKDDWLYVTGFSISESPADDLQAANITCPLIISSNNDNFFDVEVYNNGANAQDKYRVEVGILRLDGVFEPFASTENVPAVASHSSKTVRVVGKTDKYGTQDIAARVVLNGDGNSANDISDYHTTKVEAGPAYNCHADEPGSTSSLTTIPMDMYYSSSVTQTIYTAEMLGLEKDSYKISGLAWEYIASKDIPNVNLRVMLGTTDKDTYNTNRPAFENQGNQVVYEGKVSFTKDEGDNVYKWLPILFPQNAFELPKDKNLVVTVFMNETANNGEFPVLFKVFNSPNAGPDSSDKLSHTLSGRDNQDFNLDNVSKIYTDVELPTLHLGENLASVSVGAVGSDDIDMKAVIRGNNVSFYGNVAYASFYDMQGRLLRAAAVTGDAMPLNLAAGVYVLKMQDQAGNAKTMKFIVR